MIILDNHSHISWACEHIAQSAMFKNRLNSAQIVWEINIFLISVPAGIEVGTFENTTWYSKLYRVEV